MVSMRERNDQITFTCSKEKHRVPLQAIADKYGVTLSIVARWAVEHYIMTQVGTHPSINKDTSMEAGDDQPR